MPLKHIREVLNKKEVLAGDGCYQALFNLLKKILNGGIEGNPFAVDEVKAGLKVIAKIRGIKDPYDALD